MRNSKGQALVEFIIILPIFLLVTISLIDIGNIFLKKYSLESDIDTISFMYEKSDIDGINNYVSDKGIKISYEYKDKFTLITIKKDIQIISPIINYILGKYYEVKCDRSIYKK